MSGQLRAVENELRILQIVNQQRWVREDELAILTGLSLEMVRRTCIRLEKSKEIYRDRFCGGYFIRLRMKGAERLTDGHSGKGVEIPESWRHDCLAIRAMGFLRDALNQSDIETEAQIRKRIQSGKLPDGLLHPSKIRLEAEVSRKTGKLTMGRMVDATIQHAKDRQTTVITYPYPPEHCERVNHEHRLATAIRQRWGDGDAPCIKLLRCIMPSALAFAHARPQRFELIDLPPLPKNARLNRWQVISEAEGYHWVDTGDTSTLMLDDAVIQLINWKKETEFMPAMAESDDTVSAQWGDDFSQFQISVKNAWITAHKTGADIYTLVP